MTKNYIQGNLHAPGDTPISPNATIAHTRMTKTSMVSAIFRPLCAALSRSASLLALLYIVEVL